MINSFKFPTKCIPSDFMRKVKPPTTTEKDGLGTRVCSSGVSQIITKIPRNNCGRSG